MSDTPGKTGTGPGRLKLFAEQLEIFFRPSELEFIRDRTALGRSALEVVGAAVRLAADDYYRSGIRRRTG